MIFSFFGSLAGSALAFVIALSIIVFVHEYGHYIVGRWCGISAEVFSLGFGAVVWHRYDMRGTKWQIAALPFGGYVRFAGDASAASEPDPKALAALDPIAARHTLDGAPLWARALTIAAGPFFNFSFSIFIFTAFFMAQGIATNEAVVGSVRDTAPFAKALERGDLILDLGGQPVLDLVAFYKIAGTLTPQESTSYTVMRRGQEVSVRGPYPFPAYVDQVQSRSAALEAGLQERDMILAVNGAQIYGFAQIVEKVKVAKGAPTTLTVARQDQVFDVTLVPKLVDLPKAEGGFEQRWLLGIMGGLAFEPKTRRTGPFEGIGLASFATWRIITTNLSGIGHLLTGSISSCNISGPIGIAQVSGDMARKGPLDFLRFLAMLSTAIGLMNLFPIPVLDGGHLVMLGYEAVVRRKPSAKLMGGIMRVGLIILLTLMAFAFSNDLFCP